MIRCINKLVENHGISREQSEEILELYTEVGDSTLIRTAEDFIEQLKFHRESNKLANAHTMNIRKLFREVLSGKPEKWFRGILKHMEDISNRQQARKNTRIGRILNALEQHPKLFGKLLKDKLFAKDLVTELFPFTGKPKTENKLAFQLAKAIFLEKKAQVFEANAYGAGMGWLDDHVTAQWHDPIRLKAAGKSKWINDILPLLDLDRTRHGLKKLQAVDDPRKYLDEVWEQLTSKTDEFDWSGDISSKSIKERLAFGRELHFKDADAWLAYNKKYGNENPLEAILQGMNAMDDRVELLRGMGANPKLEFESLLDQVRLADKSLFSKKHINDLQSLWKQISGEAFIVGRPSMAKFTSGLIASTMAALMGKAMISSFGDIATSAVALSSHGKSFLGTYRDLFTSINRKFSKQSQAEKEYLLRHLNVAFEGAIETAMSRVISTDMIAGKLSNMAQKMFQLSGLNWWTNTWREAFARSASMHLVESLSKKWSDLPEIQRKILQRYNINGNDWKRLQRIGGFSLKERVGDTPRYKNAEFTDEKFITSEWVELNKGGKELAFKLDNFFVNESRIAVPEAAAADRAAMMRTFQRGTLPGSIAALFWTFRSHPVVMINKILPRMYEMGLPSLLHLTPMIGLGYSALAVKDMLRGKEPRDPDDVNTFLESIKQSGFAAGIGDFFIEEVGRHHSDWDENLLGVHYEFFKDVGSLFKGMATGDAKASEAWNLIRERTPFMNLFYTELAFNYLVHYQIMETLNPGYVYKIESWTKGVDAQQYFLKPSNFVSYGGLQ